MWAFWPVPDYHQMGHRQQQQQLGPATVWGVGGGGGEGGKPDSDIDSGECLNIWVRTFIGGVFVYDTFTPVSGLIAQSPRNSLSLQVDIFVRVLCMYASSFSIFCIPFVFR